MNSSMVFEICLTALLGAQLGLLAWLGRKVDERVGAVEKSIMAMELIIDRGERHETDIAKLDERLTNLQIEVARAGAH